MFTKLGFWLTHKHRWNYRGPATELGKENCFWVIEECWCEKTRYVSSTNYPERGGR